ncbi:MAG: acyltransferase family protein [Pseudonocardiaceae bacterium]|nr:acyltransferase family protein [Pseudonocardiaceae bacterium]
MSGQTQSSPFAAGARSRRKISWDVVRAGCVTLVVLYHSTFLGVELHPELIERRLRFPFQVGASTLLVISAYFACVTIGRGTMLRYWWGRVARIFPAFAAAVVLIFAVLRVASPEGWLYPGFRDLASNLMMLWNWKPQDFAYIDGSHWTVPLQLMGFTAAALLFRSKLGHGRRLRTVLWGAVLIPMAQWPLRVSDPPETYRMLVDGFGLHRWHLFVAGVAIWMWSTRRISTPHFGLLLAACMAGQALHNHAGTPEGLVADWGSTYAVWMAIAVIALVARGPDWDRVIPSWARGPIQWFAGISYGVFLMHQTIGYLVMRGLQDVGFGPTLQTGAMVLTAIGLGWMLTRTVETPAHKFLTSAYDRVALARNNRRSPPESQPAAEAQTTR